MISSIATVDWISITYNWDAIPERCRETNLTGLQLVTEWLGLPQGWAFDKARYGYQLGVKYSDGVTVYLSPYPSQQGVHVVYPGSALTGARAMEALARAAKNQGNVTRVDITVDIRDGKSTVETYRALYEQGIYDGYPRSWALLTGTKGATLYIGARSSDKYMRIYDKAAQMNKNGQAWIRVELECKGDFARAVAWQINTNTLAIIPSLIQGFVDFHEAEWHVAMESANGALTLKGEKKTPDTQKWLEQSIAPMLARYRKDNPDGFQKFMNVLYGMIDSDTHAE